jgi:hypothetical protein
MKASRILLTRLLTAGAGLATIALLIVLLLDSSPSHAAGVLMPPPPTHATVDLIQAPHATTASFSITTLTLTHNASGKASLDVRNQTSAAQTIEAAGKSYTLKAGASVVVTLAVGTTTFRLHKSQAQLTVSVWWFIPH